MTKQRGDHRLLAAGPDLTTKAISLWVPNSTKLSLRICGNAPSPRCPGRRATEGGVVGLRVGDIEDHAVDAHQAQAADRRLLACQARPADEQSARTDAAPGRRPAVAGPHKDWSDGASLFAVAKSTSVLEDLANGQVGEEPHGKHHPKDNFVGQFAASLIASSSGLKGLANGLGWDNLFESRQSIQDPPRFIGRQRTLSLMHASHSLLVASFVGKPKVTRGCDLRLFQRYWG